MAKVNMVNSTEIDSEAVVKHAKKQSKKSKPRPTTKLGSKKIETNIMKPHQQLCKKKDIVNIIKSEHNFISSLFDILDLSKLNQGRRNDSDEEDNGDDFLLADIPEQKVFKKQTQKKNSQVGVKNKAFPSTVEGLEKELAELKGTPMTYHKKLRKKGLQTRLLKKKRKEHLKLRKAALKSAKKNKSAVNGLSKSKPILNSDGNVVSNKFDFADTDIKKESKKKPGAVNNETHGSQSLVLPNGSLRENFKNKTKLDSNKSSDSPVKKENTSETIKTEMNSNEQSKNKPIFNKDNKIVFSKIYMPENHKKTKRESKNKNPKKILEKLKEETKKISEIAKEDKEKADSLKEKSKWATALKRASGEKVKDDPELLRKSIAREKNKKMRSQKKWKARIDHVEKEKQEKQKKRKENIQARKTDKKKKKMKKAIKKGSYVPL
ncbi:surfeit locus protein 6 homolog [Macrosteles quadrilineatus]|uniref:surfeit locus protein 6 homolog n=1 Tax=Macrosteles quadrilineatus TaxID=74068 RepID=UPI0023E095F9|nr:surfeit locus protein 6 homolog [Macrosteles quadrilineatus]